MIWILLPVGVYGFWLWWHEPVPIPINEWRAIRNAAGLAGSWDK